MEGHRPGAIMMACGESARVAALPPMERFVQAVKKLFAPLVYGGADKNLITGTETSPNITQSETYSTGNPDDPNQILVAYNDSRGRNASPINISGASYSSDGGTTFTRITAASGQSPFANTFGDPVALYNKPTGTWFTVWLDAACGGQGLGGYKTTTPGVAASWTHFCVHTGGSDDRNSGWADNNPASPFYGRMYISYNDFAIGGGSLRVHRSTDNGLTWSAAVQVEPGFIRDVQLTGDASNGNLYLAGMDEGGGGLAGPRSNKIYRSTDGGATWAITYTAPTFAAPGRANCTTNAYFVCMYSPNTWRHMGWGEPAALNGVVSLVYSQHGAGADPGDVYYIRSTDAGATFGAPFKLNTDATTRLQWQPNLSVTPTGSLFAVWYDERESATCTVGAAGVPCYRMYARKSNDNGATWLPDDAYSDVVSPLPAQNDPGIQATYAGDYDYGSAPGVQHLNAWDDGRNAIPAGTSQQDVFFDKDLAGFSVTSTVPACGSIISTQPADFVVNVTDPVQPATLQGSDFTVNGTPANSVTYISPQTTMTFHFTSTPVITQGLQTMNIAAGAFNKDATGDPILAFTGTFRYDATLLMVTTTVPPVGGVFTPPAPGVYQYDVNWNEAVDPASVQTTDLTLSGTAGATVTAVTVINANTTTRFTLNIPFGGTLTANIAAGAITDAFGNPNAAFSGNYTVGVALLKTITP